MKPRFLLLALLPLKACTCTVDGTDDDGLGVHPTPDTFSAIVDDYAPGALLSLWSSGPDDVWVVGGERGSPVVLRFDGSSWRRDDPPVTEQLWWVHGFANGPVFVVGDRGAVARWSNGSWEAMDSGFPGTTFYGVWGAAPDDVWAVGGPSQIAVDTVGDVVIHYDGTNWTRVAVPFLESKPMSASTNLFKIWGTTPNDMIIVGDGGETLHYDGSTFQPHENPAPGITLFTLYGRAADDVFAIGGLGSPVLLHFDGQTWSDVVLPNDAPQVMQGVWTAPGRPLFVSGYDGYVACMGSDGSWTTFTPATTHALHGIMSDGSGGVWAAGGDIESFSDDYVGALVIGARTVPAITE